MVDYRKPLPRVSPDNRPFWEAARRHELVLPRCGDCGELHYPPGPVCPFCFSDRLNWQRVSGHGAISTFVVVHKEWFPAFQKDIPYNVAQVELEEGPRIPGHIVGIANADLRIGLPVEVTFQDVTGEITLPCFRPRD
jgi:uncharacterized OB-fold protein